MVVESVEKRGVSSSELKDKIILRAVESTPMHGPCKIRRYWRTGYHVLDLNTGGASSLPDTVHDYGSMGSMVAVGSRLYIFGKSMLEDGTLVSGDPSNSTTPNQGSSYLLDLTKPQKGWKRAASLTVDQQRPNVVAFGGKIYAFRDSDFSCICEVFDPQLNQWRRIKSPPGGGDRDGDGEVKLELTPPVMADFKNNRIIVCFNNISTMYAYYPSEDRWQCMVEGFRGWSEGGEPVTLADGVIYVHNRRIKGFFRAYDLTSKEWLNVRVSPDVDYESYLYFSRYRTLLHRGNGLLCLLTSASPGCESADLPLTPPTTVVHVVQFKVELVKINESKEVLVTPLSSEYYRLDSRCSVYLYLPV